MKPNKKLFFDVLKSVSADCEAEGFVGHPAYISAWEPTNQAYEATLIRSDFSKFIDQLNVSFYPSWKSFRFHVTRSQNLFGINDIEDIPTDAGEWSDCWLYEPFDEYELMSGTAWNIFSIKNFFGVSKREPLNVEAEAYKVCTAFRRNSKFLFDALRGNYHGRFVSIEHYEIERPK